LRLARRPLCELVREVGSTHLLEVVRAVNNLRIESVDYFYMPADRAEFGRHIRLACEQLGKTAFEMLVDLDETIVVALRDYDTLCLRDVAPEIGDEFLS
jgi:hypothetical protein